MAKSLRAGVVGVGYLGRFHAQKYAALAKEPSLNLQLTGVFDASAERAKAVAQELQCQVFASLEDCLQRVDVVTIASSTPTHFEIARAALQAGVHVNLEKPMTEKTSEARELCRLAKEKGLGLQIGHVERFNPALTEARKKLKDPLFIECHRLAPFKPRSQDVSVVLDLMIHDIDVILTLVPSEVVKVAAVGTAVMTRAHDLANARLEFANGTVANVTASRVSQKAARKFRVFQSNQYLSIDFASGEVTLLTKTGEFSGDPEASLPLELEAWNLEKGDALLEETRAFVLAVRNGQDPVVTGEDGLRALEVCEKIIDSIEGHLKRSGRLG